MNKVCQGSPGCATRVCGDFEVLHQEVCQGSPRCATSVWGDFDVSCARPMFQIFTSLYLLKGGDRRDEDFDDDIGLDSEIPEA
jgi:hypothetical protein